jgi:hypothetical protein
MKALPKKMIHSDYPMIEETVDRKVAQVQLKRIPTQRPPVLTRKVPKKGGILSL